MLFCVPTIIYKAISPTPRKQIIVVVFATIDIDWVSRYVDNSNRLDYKTKPHKHLFWNWNFVLMLKAKQA